MRSLVHAFNIMTTNPRYSRFHARNDAGFGLVELIVVVVILCTLMAVAIPLYLSGKSKVHGAAVVQSARTLERSVMQYRNDHFGVLPVMTGLPTSQLTFILPTTVPAQPGFGPRDLTVVPARYYLDRSQFPPLIANSSIKLGAYPATPTYSMTAPASLIPAANKLGAIYYARIGSGTEANLHYIFHVYAKHKLLNGRTGMGTTAYCWISDLPDRIVGGPSYGGPAPGWRLNSTADTVEKPCTTVMR